MWSKIRTWLPAVGVALVVLVIVLVIRPLVEIRQGPDDQMTSATTEQPSQGASTRPNSSIETGDDHEDASSPVATCKEVLGTESYTSFLATLFKYEALFQERASSDSYEEIATSLYIDLHTSIAPPNQSTFEVEVDNDPGSVTCKAPTQSQLIAVISPTISVYELNGANRQLINGPFIAPAHFTVWVKQGDKWLVDNEHR